MRERCLRPAQSGAEHALEVEPDHPVDAVVHVEEHARIAALKRVTGIGRFEPGQQRPQLRLGHRSERNQRQKRPILDRGHRIVHGDRVQLAAGVPPAALGGVHVGEIGMSNGAHVRRAIRPHQEPRHAPAAVQVAGVGQDLPRRLHD